MGKTLWIEVEFTIEFAPKQNIPTSAPDTMMALLDDAITSGMALLVVLTALSVKPEVL